MGKGIWRNNKFWHKATTLLVTILTVAIVVVAIAIYNDRWWMVVN